MEAGGTTRYRRVARQLLRGAALLLAAVASPIAESAAIPVAAPDVSTALDIRIIVDASAWSDSAAQRAGLDSAVSALLTLLPPGTTSTIWPLGAVTAPSGAPAHPNTDGRVSAATGTSTATALVPVFEKLVKEWTPASSNLRRHVVLLVAGPAPGQHPATSPDSASEKRLLNELLPRLHETRAAVHAIAPSGTDTRLLQQLVVATDGWYTEAGDPAGAERNLLELLENLAQRDTLLLQDGLVKFDSSVTTARLVLFRSDPNLPARLVPPGSLGFSQFNAPSNVSWRPEARFDVVTITKPTPGTWQILSEDDPRNRAFAQASLQLVMSAPPRNAVVGKRREFTLALHQDGKVITDRSVLDHVIVKVTQYQNNSEQRLWFPLDNGRAGDVSTEDGIYTVVLDDFLPAQSYRFVAEIEGLNFQRRHQMRMDMHDQSIWAQLTPGVDDKHFSLSVLPRHGLVDPETMTVLAYLSQAGMEPRELRVARFTSTTWRLELALETRSSHDVLEINVQANTAAGQPISLWLPPMTLSAVTPTRDHLAHLDGAIDAHSHSAAAATSHPADALGSVEDSGDVAPADAQTWPIWIISGVQLLSINAILAVLGWLALRYWRQRENRWHTAIESAIAHD